MVAKAYEEMPGTTFIKSWRKAWPDIENVVANPAEDENEQPILIIEEDNNTALLNDLRKLSTSDDHLEEKNVNEWVTGDDDLEKDFFSDNQIVEKDVEEASKQGIQEDSDENDLAEKISHEEGKKTLQLAAMYIKQQDLSTAVDIDVDRIPDESARTNKSTSYLE
ncbi:hypothetical protein J6590_060583 [Homalodisca vitripennis]|nr:hypothetical protein J6590_060583 [Homalodisca vitripennis]